MKESFFDLTRHYAVFVDQVGNYHGKKRIDPNCNVFTYCKRSYVFSPLNSTYLKLINPIYKTRLYLYNLDNPEPLILKDKSTPLITAQQFGILIETNALMKLNELSKKNWLLDLLTIPNLIILLVIIGVYIYFKIYGLPT